MCKPTITNKGCLKEVPKGWGREIWIHNSEQYCGKILEFDEGKKFSMHFHKIKTETWYVLKGRLLFEWIDFEKGNLHDVIVNEGETIHIPAELCHRLTAHEPSQILEVSTQHFDEDSYRVKKGD